MKHLDSFKKGGTGSYTVIVQNQGDDTTEGVVNVALTLPKGLKYKSLSGLGWTIDATTLTCTRSNPLEPGSSYPPITLKVHVGQNASDTLTPSASVWGGGAQSGMSVSNLTHVK